jgi:hypothetical protein
MAYSDKEEDAWQAREFIYKLLGPVSADGLHNSKVVHLAEFAKLLKAHLSNGNTPTEDFIVNLVSGWADGRELTPDDVTDNYIEHPDGYRSWFDNAVDTTRHFNERYPETLKQGADEARS